MKISFPSRTLGLLYICMKSIPNVLGATYDLSESISGPGFFNSFDWQTISDPTHGRVRYVDRSTAQQRNLSHTSQDTFILRTDYISVLDPDGPGRDSVRIKSKKTYTTHVAVFDVRHMPQGCGTWPAIWETNEDNWPHSGEVDILEGVNDQSPNAATLHTSPGCAMPDKTDQTGTPGQRDCNTNINGNAGCSVKFPTEESYGSAFNANGGGWYVIERSYTYVKIWFWSRNDGTVPRSIMEGGSALDTDELGPPNANFPDTTCNMNEHFGAHNIIINLTLCGDWAGSVYGHSGCPGNCEDFVNNNPEAFEQAYFDLASLRIYL